LRHLRNKGVVELQWLSQKFPVEGVEIEHQLQFPPNEREYRGAPIAEGEGRVFDF